MVATAAAPRSRVITRIPIAINMYGTYILLDIHSILMYEISIFKEDFTSVC